MTLGLRYLLLAIGGVVCGLIARGLSVAVRGRFSKQLIFHRLVDGIAVIPGIALVVWLVPLGVASEGLVSAQLMGLFALTYAGTRILTHKWATSRSAGREMMVPFTHWLELLRTDPHAAHQFLKGYLADRGDTALLELRGAYSNLERHHSDQPNILVALDQLRAEIARREPSAIPRGSA